MTDASPAPAPAPIDADEADNYLDLRKNGGMHVVSDGQKRRLRAPRMRDYRKLTQLWREEAETLETQSEELQRFLEGMFARGEEREAAGQPRITDEERAEDRRLGRMVREQTEDACLRWWAEAIRTLGVTANDCEVDGDDDLPVFLATVDSINQVLTHWRTVPSPSGAR